MEEKGWMAMKLLTGIGFGLVVASLSTPTFAQFTVKDRQQWMSASTSLLPITAPQRSVINSVSNTSSYLSFGTSATVNEIGSDQVVWGKNSELTTGDVVATFCNSVPTKLFWSFSSAVYGFGFEVMNNDLYEEQDFTVSFYNGTTLLGTIQQTSDNAQFWNNYDYFAGDVRLFAAEDIRGITGVDIHFSSNSMSAGAFRVNTTSPDAVPEPSGVITGIALLSMCTTLAYRARRREQTKAEL